MKLRIRGNSVRLRLTKAEVAQIGLGKMVKETTHFFNGSQFHYVFEPTNTVNNLEAHMIDNTMVVKAPLAVTDSWANSNTVALIHEQTLPHNPNEKLFILIEKDFACLKTRENETEDESDMFANPNAHKGSCG